MTHRIAQEMIALLPRLRRFAISLTGSRDRADDLVQIACEKALAAQASWTPGTRFDAWMFRILRNAWIDGLRRNRSEGIRETLDDHPELPGAHGETEQIARLTLDAVLKAMDQLPPEQREVLTLVCVEEFSYAEAASMLDIAIGTVMSRLARAREKISIITGIERGAKR